MRFLSTLAALAAVATAGAQDSKPYYLVGDRVQQDETSPASAAVTPEERVRQLEAKVEDGFRDINARLDRIERALSGQPSTDSVAAKASAPAVKRVQVDGFWYTKHADGRLEWCAECNGTTPTVGTTGSLPGSLQGSVQLVTGPSGTWSPTVGVPVSGPVVNPNWRPAAPVVAASAPFSGCTTGACGTTLTTGVTYAVPSSGFSTAAWEGATTSTYAEGVAPRGIIRRVFRPLRGALRGGCCGG